MRNRLRQRAIIALLKTNDSPPKILASQLFFLFDVEPQIASITDNMTVENVLVVVGNILHAKQRLHEDVDVWAGHLFKQAGLPFTVSIPEDIMDAPVASLSVVSSQPASGKTEAQPAMPKRKTRRIYLELAIKLLEKGCTHKGLVEKIIYQFPDLNRETVSTFASDVQNPKYSPIKDRKVVKLPPDGRLIFEDCIRPALTLIENPNYAGTDKTDTEPITVPVISNVRE